MALLRCIDCGNMVSDKAESCPKCGCPIQHIKEENGIRLLPQLESKTDGSALSGAISEKNDVIVVRKPNENDPNDLINAPVRNYDSGRESFVQKICDDYVHVKEGAVESIYKFLGCYKFLNRTDRALFLSIFGSKIEAYKAKITREERRVLESNETMYAAICSLHTDTQEDDLYYEMESDIGHDSIAQSYYEYHRDD